MDFDLAAAVEPEAQKSEVKPPPDAKTEGHKPAGPSPPAGSRDTSRKEGSSDSSISNSSSSDSDQEGKAPGQQKKKKEKKPKEGKKQKKPKKKSP